MTRFFYTVDEATELIKSLIINKNNLNNRVIIPDMKSLKIKDLLVEFSKNTKRNGKNK